MPDTIICTDRETWMLSGTDDDMVLSYAADDDNAPLAAVPVTADLLRVLAARVAHDGR